jgi:nitrite reductase/ring-hydroxylating ferredoxin subunit
MTNREWAVAKLRELSDPGALEFSVGNGDWPFRGFVVHWQGKVYAYANVCPHQRHPLNLIPDGFFTPDKTSLLCSSHGAIFELHTGNCIGGPCSGQSLQPLACWLDGEMVYVRAPDSQRSH